MTSPTTAASPAITSAKPAIIATRQHCEADGVGLSHYILMDRAASPAAVPDAVEPDATA